MSASNRHNLSRGVLSSSVLRACVGCRAGGENGRALVEARPLRMTQTGSQRSSGSPRPSKSEQWQRGPLPGQRRSRSSAADSWLSRSARQPAMTTDTISEFDVSETIWSPDRTSIAASRTTSMPSSAKVARTASATSGSSRGESCGAARARC
jgi:hypothetical protein